MTQIDWLLSQDTGVSSRTIWAVMMGVETTPQRCITKYDIPYDPSDFGRCFRLLCLFPEWRKNLHRVAEVFPKWGPIVDHWDEMERLWIEESRSALREAPKLYALMLRLQDECMIVDGWEKTGEASWERANPKEDA